MTIRRPERARARGGASGTGRALPVLVDAHRRLKFEWLVKERGDLDHASLDAALPGERRLVTAHAVYRLLDGICVEVDDLGMTGHARALIGMELVGWIPLRADAMLDDWEPGARAIFWRRGHDDQLAMTSSVMDVKAVGVPKARESDVREMRIGPVRPDVSFTPARLPKPPIFTMPSAGEQFVAARMRNSR